MILSVCYERKSRVSNDDAMWVKIQGKERRKEKKGKMHVCKGRNFATVVQDFNIVLIDI